MTSPWNGGTQGPESEEGKRRSDSPPSSGGAGEQKESQGSLGSASAWQPLTPRGVAAFASASFGRLFLIQLLVAVFFAGSVIWFVYSAWFPVVGNAIRALPETGQISSGRLDWKGEPTTNLAESPFLALTVDLDHRGGARSPSHLQIEFGRFNCRIFSLFGFAEVDYPRDRTVAFNRPALVPWWGAWPPALLAVSGIVMVGALVTSWALLASLYCFPAWLIGFYANRRLSFFGSWRLAGAALMPGALLMGVAVFVYGRGFLNLIDLGTAWLVHFGVGWVYLVASIVSLPRLPATGAPRTNPFMPGSAPSAASRGEDEQSNEA